MRCSCEGLRERETKEGRHTAVGYCSSLYHFLLHVVSKRGKHQDLTQFCMAQDSQAAWGIFIPAESSMSSQPTDIHQGWSGNATTSESSITTVYIALTSLCGKAIEVPICCQMDEDVRDAAFAAPCVWAKASWLVWLCCFPITDHTVAPPATLTFCLLVHYPHCPLE